MKKKTYDAQNFGITKEQLSEEALSVIKKLQANKFDGYIVGGGVRDLLLKVKPKDFDIATDATPEEIKRIFRHKAIIIGRRFKIVHILFEKINPDKTYNGRPAIERSIIEVSTYRSQQIDQNNLNEHGKILVDNDYGTIDEDAFRRDFTINALFYDPYKNKIIDFVGGIKDIEGKLIRIIGEPTARYIEDPVRILRAIRLSAKLGLDIEEESAKPFDQVSPLLVHENRSRLFEEMLKVLLSGSAYKCVELLKNSSIPKGVFVLFDRLFLSNKPSLLALEALRKSDERIASGEEVSTIYLLACMMWEMIEASQQEIIKNDQESPKQALFLSIAKTKQFAYNIGVTKAVYNLMREIWILQYDMEHPLPKKIDVILNNRRFRQAWHLFELRKQFGQKLNLQIFNCWNEYTQAEVPDKTQLIGKLRPLLQKLERKTRKSTSNQS